MIERHWDEEARILYVTASGPWSEREISEYYVWLRPKLQDLRQSGIKVRVLSDASDMPPQPPEFTRFVREQMQRTYLPGDRLAVLVADTEQQAHIRTLVKNYDVGVFTSRIAAEMWLLME